MNACPVCSTPVAMMLTGSPYRVCEACGTAFQSPARASWRSSDDRPALAPMPERDREVNRQLARWLVDTCLSARPARTLDLGCGYPFLAHSLAALGCEAVGVDVDPVCEALGRDLGVP
ncbi:MAG TPA: hypothetical protein VNB03_12735, partial [Casimicrobiaceae bacterium]|nr:hypothetical protein [Casimicrobiaceae bacterium]